MHIYVNHSWPNAGQNWLNFLGNPWVQGGGGNIIGFEKFKHYSSKIDFFTKTFQNSMGNAGHFSTYHYTFIFAKI